MTETTDEKKSQFVGTPTPVEDNDETISQSLKVLRDLNENESDSVLPQNMLDMGVIENPSNKEEILIMGGYRDKNIYIYNTKKRTFRKNKVDFTFLDKYMTLRGMNISTIRGIEPNTIIVIGTCDTPDTSKCGFYCIFNTLSLAWENLNSDKLKSNDSKYCITDQPMSVGSSIVRYEVSINIFIFIVF